MTKLTDMVKEDVTVAERVKINAHRFRLAGIGLISKVESKRLRLYKQIIEMGESYGSNQTLVGKASQMGSGAINLALEQSQRVFDELVEEGERALTQDQDKPKLMSSVEKISTTKPVSKTKASKSKATRSKPSKPEPTKPVLAPELISKLATVKQQLPNLADLPEAMNFELQALLMQVTEGDVRGHRPAKSKVEQQKQFDARRKLKGTKPEQALQQLEARVNQLSQKQADRQPATTE